MTKLRSVNTPAMNWRKAALIAGIFAFWAWAAVPAPSTAAPAGNGGLETFGLADRSNLRQLANGDFLFRLARDRRNGVVYWAYMGSTREVIAAIPDPAVLTDDSVARSIILRVTDLPTRVGCGVGVIHQSKVYLVPEDAKYTGRDFKLEVSPLFAVGEVRNDTSGKTPTTLLSYMNFVPRSD